jgi:hypothetical protein
MKYSRSFASFVDKNTKYYYYYTKLFLSSFPQSPVPDPQSLIYKIAVTIKYQPKVIGCF